MKKKGRRRRREGEEEDEKGDEPPLDVLARFSTERKHTHPYEHMYANPTVMSIFEDRASKSSRLTKSSQAPHCKWEHRLPPNAQRR